MHFHEYHFHISYLYYKLASNFSFYANFYLFFHILFCYFILKKTQFHHTQNSNFDSFHFYIISNYKNHNFAPIVFSIAQISN